MKNGEKCAVLFFVQKYNDARNINFGNNTFFHFVNFFNIKLDKNLIYNRPVDNKLIYLLV